MIKRVKVLTLLHKRALMSAIFAVSASSTKNILAASQNYDQLYDLAVIGGGSGGLATAF